MTRLSVNINKIATLRNARGGNLPDVTKAAVDCERFGAQGITVHPRPDQRHIRYSDVLAIRPLIKTEFNIEGNPMLVDPAHGDVRLRSTSPCIDAASLDFDLAEIYGYETKAFNQQVRRNIERFPDDL